MACAREADAVADSLIEKRDDRIAALESKNAELGVYAVELRLNIAALESQQLPTAGIEEDDTCNRNGCKGTIILPPVVNCSCHINPPCSACTDNELQCDECFFTVGVDDEQHPAAFPSPEALRERIAVALSPVQLLIDIDIDIVVDGVMDAIAANPPAKPTPQEQCDRLKEIACKCPDRTGTTAVECCNLCGMPTTTWWHAEPAKPVTVDQCDVCSTALIDDCPRCGAPVCCPKCCEESAKPSTVESGQRWRGNGYVYLLTSIHDDGFGGYATCVAFEIALERIVVTGTVNMGAADILDMDYLGTIDNGDTT